MTSQQTKLWPLWLCLFFWPSCFLLAPLFVEKLPIIAAGYPDCHENSTYCTFVNTDLCCVYGTAVSHFTFTLLNKTNVMLFTLSCILYQMQLLVKVRIWAVLVERFRSRTPHANVNWCFSSYQKKFSTIIFSFPKKNFKNYPILHYNYAIWHH